MRVYDDPNHRHYGPARRLWVILSGLYGTSLERADEDYQHEWGQTWDTFLVRLMDLHADETVNLRSVVRRFMHTVAVT